MKQERKIINDYIYDIGKDGKYWWWRQRDGDQDERGLSFEQISRLPGHWQNSFFTTKKELLNLLEE